MSHVRKAIVPAAGLGTRQYPVSSAVRKEFFPLPGRDGRSRPAIQIVVEEALSAGVEQVCLVVQPGAEAEFRDYFSALPQELAPCFEGKPWVFEQTARLAEIGERLSFAQQPEQIGLGHAVWCARQWAGGEPVLVLLGDHVYVSTGRRSCAAQLVDAFRGASLSALVPVGPDQLHRFGVAGGEFHADDPRRIHAECFIEKPDRKTARARCTVDGAGEDRFLAHFGMHVFAPGIFDVLDDMVAAGRAEHGEYELTTAQDTLCRRELYEGYLLEGRHYDVGTPAGLLQAQLALAAEGALREDLKQIWDDTLTHHLR